MNTHTTINPQRLARKICEVAMRYNGLKEIVPNAKFDNPKTDGLDPEASELIAMYKAIGWVDGWSHCSAYVEVVIRKALQLEGATKEQIAKFGIPMQLGVMNSVRAFKKLGVLDPVSKAGVGSIWLARHGITDKGHAGICLSPVQAGMLNTIEANTSKDAVVGEKDREGDWITTKMFPMNQRGSLRTQGVVTVESICKLVNS